MLVDIVLYMHDTNKANSKSPNSVKSYYVNCFCDKQWWGYCWIYMVLDVEKVGHFTRLRKLMKGFNCDAG